MRLSNLNLDAAGNSFIDVSDDMVLAVGYGFTRVELNMTNVNLSFDICD